MTFRTYSTVADPLRRSVAQRAARAKRVAVPCGMTLLSSLAEFRRAWVVVLAAWLLIAAGCSSSHTRATPASTTTVLATTTTTPQEGAVLAAYRAGWAAFEHAGQTSNIFDTMLPATMVDPMLQQVRRNLAGDQVNGIVARGTYVLNPHVESITATAAVVVDCVYSTAILVYAKTGQPVPPITKPEYDGVKATLVLVGSTWKVSQQSLTEGHCAPGY